MSTQSRGLRNNNPLNIRKSADVFQGEIKSEDKAFKAFKSMAYGYRAAFKLLYNYYDKYKLDTIRKMITRWAPEKENDTKAYIGVVSKKAKIRPDTVLFFERDEMCAIVAAMSEVENITPAVMSDVIAGWKLFKGES
jgi:hypothetical protein